MCGDEWNQYPPGGRPFFRLHRPESQQTKIKSNFADLLRCAEAITGIAAKPAFDQASQPQCRQTGQPNACQSILRRQQTQTGKRRQRGN